MSTANEAVRNVPDEFRQVRLACRDSVIAVAVFSCSISLLLLVPSLYMLQVYDRVLTSGSRSTLVLLSLIVLFLFATMAALEWVRSQILIRVSERAEGMLADRLYELSFRQALATGGRQGGGQPLQDWQGLRQFLTGQGLLAFFDAPWLPVYCIVMFAFHPWYGWICVGSAIVLIVIAIANQRSTAALLVEANRESAQVHAAVGRTLINSDTIEALGMLGNLRERWKRRSSSVMRSQMLASERGGGWTTLSRMLRLMLQSSMLGVGAWLVLEDQITPGIMIAGSILLGRALAPIDQITGVWRQFIAAKEQYRRLSDWLGRLPQQPQRMELPAPTGRVAVQSATVVPPGAKVPAIRQVSFEVAPGEVVGIVGPSASGKSTLARAILGVWPCAQGTVRLDGANVYGWSRAELGPHVGYLPQDVELFDGSIAENIARFGDVDGSEVVAAARLAGIHDMILQMPQGYDTVIGGAGGIVLSGGQRQRVGLARALYGRPSLVVLDEPNSSLDEAGDQALLAALGQLKERGTTVIVISHRPNLLAVVDKLLALRAGELVAFGPRDHVLMQLSGARRAEAGVRESRPGSTTTQVVPIRPSEGVP